MCGHQGHRHSIFCILPPHILESIARSGNPSQRRAALKTLAVDSTFRALRASAAMRPTVAARSMAAPNVLQRTIHSAGGQETLPGTVVRNEGDPPTGDVAVDEAYDGLGHTWTFFDEVFGRNSIDDEGMPLLATVHYQPSSTTTPSGTGSRWSSATATAPCSTVSP